VIHIFTLLSQAMAKAKSTDPVKVAAALEGLKVKSFNGEVDDAQGRPPAAAAAVPDSVWQKADAKYPYSPENTGMTLDAGEEYESYVSSTPTTCQMKRPA
jgi:branched-chain amino acid transport system substrate-binding protein